METRTLRIDLNIDVGELDAEPEELYALATTVNLACGGHAGDDASMARAVRAAMRSNARIAAHPSYPDREGFGRRARFCEADVLRVAVREQCEALQRVATELGAGSIRAMKPHGALYHDVMNDAALAAALLDATRAALPDLSVVIGPASSALAAAAEARGLSFEREGFADRTYEHGRIVPRSRPDALILEPARCAEQATALARSGDVDTLCVHGDSPGAASIAAAVREALKYP